MYVTVTGIALAGFQFATVFADGREEPLTGVEVREGETLLQALERNCPIDAVIIARASPSPARSG